MGIPALFEAQQVRDVLGPAIRPGGLALTREAIDRTDLSVNARVIDIGCGSAATVDHLVRDRGFDAMGIDPSAVMLADARGWRLRRSLVQGEAEHLPVAGGCMDAVIMECVLSLVADTAQALGECRRVLKPGGWLIVSDIYARAPASGCSQDPFPVRSCLGGAMGQERLDALVRGWGFDCLIWEDRSDLLKQMAAQMVFSFGSMAAFWSAFCTTGASQEMEERIRDIRPGYYLLMARKY